MSPPARVAWIETCAFAFGNASEVVSPPARVAWIETYVVYNKDQYRLSPPARVAWIETWCCR